MNVIFEAARLEALLGSCIDQSRLAAIEATTPAALLPIAHYAACWGISDDIVRRNLLKMASEEAVQNLNKVVEIHDEQLDDWLAGPEAGGPTFSDAYIAFSAMRMASDGT